MIQEAFKKQVLSSHETFQAKRWEGRPWSFKLKYCIANYPEFAFGTLCFLVIAPAMLAYQIYNFNEERAIAFRKYKGYYAVVRHDDPNIESIKFEKETGRQYFPQ